jgi:ketosteroid isomerase-like protein
MSQANVDLVLKLQAAPDVDLAELFRSDARWSAFADAVAPLFHADFETVPPGVPGTESVFTGLDGLREAWLGWTEPWLTYRTEIKQAIDAGERVLLLTRDYGCGEGGTEEVGVDGSAVWTVREGRIARAEFFAHRADAFEAAGVKQ